MNRSILTTIGLLALCALVLAGCGTASHSTPATVGSAAPLDNSDRIFDAVTVAFACSTKKGCHRAAVVLAKAALRSDSPNSSDCRAARHALSTAVKPRAIREAAASIYTDCFRAGDGAGDVASPPAHDQPAPAGALDAQPVWDAYADLAACDLNAGDDCLNAYIAMETAATDFGNAMPQGASEVCASSERGYAADLTPLSDASLSGGAVDVYAARSAADAVSSDATYVADDC